MTEIQTNLFTNHLQVLVEENTRNDDWVNATKWCNYFGKKWAQIAKQPNFKKYLETLQGRLFTHSDKKALYEVKGKPKQTWVHPLVAIKLAEELSPEFDVYVKETFKRYLDGDITLADDIIQRNQSDKDLEWINQRVQGKIARKRFTNELKQHGVTGVGYAMNTNAIYQPLFGKTAKEIKTERAIEHKETARDDMTLLELAAVNLAELAALERIKQTQVTGNDATTEISFSASSKVKEAIKDIL
jgi:hypothetical protein